jgi:hypothetical protein
MRPDDGFVRHDPTVADLTAELASLRQELESLAAEHASLRASTASRVAELEREVAELGPRAARYDQIAKDFSLQKGPLALRVADDGISDAATTTPPALASPGTLITRRLEVEPAPPAGSGRLKRGAQRVGRVLYSPVRPILRRLLWRVRAFFNQPTLAEVHRLSSDLQALGKRIEDILVTLAMTRDRD